MPELVSGIYGFNTSISNTRTYTPTIFYRPGCPTDLPRGDGLGIALGEPYHEHCNPKCPEYTPSQLAQFENFT
jgi:hypothetical protein